MFVSWNKGAKPLSCVMVSKRAGLWLKPRGERCAKSHGHVRRMGSLMGLPYFQLCDPANACEDFTTRD